MTANDTPEQTKAVLRLLACEDEDSASVAAEWPLLQSWIAAQDNRTTIPFASALAELVPPLAVRLRRDFTTVLNLIRSHAILHQRNRPCDERGRIVAGVTDYAVVRELVADLIANSSRRRCQARCARPWPQSRRCARSARSQSATQSWPPS